jgi:Skp family chaperone for outer membrane proteins
MRRAPLQIAVLVLFASLAVLTHRVWGEAQQPEGSPAFRVGTVDLLSLLEDLLQTDEYRPARDQFRQDWEERIGVVQQTLAQIEGELRLATPADPGTRALQQRYQQTAFEFQNMQREAQMNFDAFSAEQAAAAYEKLHAAAQELAGELGYSHLIATRRGPAILDRNNLATVTQEILARPVIASPESDEITARLRERLAIPVRPEPAEGGETSPAEGEDATEE